MGFSLQKIFLNMFHSSRSYGKMPFVLLQMETSMNSYQSSKIRHVYLGESTVCFDFFSLEIEIPFALSKNLNKLASKAL